LTEQPAIFSLRLDHAIIHVTASSVVRGTLYIRDGLFTHAGAGEPSETERTTRTIDVQGASIVPLLVENGLRARAAGNEQSWDLVAGNAATFAVTRQHVTAAQVRGTLMIAPDDLIAIIVDGEMIAWEGRPATDTISTNPNMWTGTWVDRPHALAQHLLPEGRYTETRNGRADAYTGLYWTRTNRIVYLDDSGFWAFGLQHHNTLYHAHFTMRRIQNGKQD